VVVSMSMLKYIFNFKKENFLGNCSNLGEKND